MRRLKMMRRLKNLFFATLIATSQGSLVAAQSDDAPVSSRQIYTQAREELDALIMQRRMGDAIRMFDDVVEVEDAELDALDTQMQNLFPSDFENVGIVRSVVHKNGFRQEMIAYWTGRDFLYLYLLMHTDTSGIRLLNFQFDTDFHILNDLF